MRNSNGPIPDAAAIITARLHIAPQTAQAYECTARDYERFALAAEGAERVRFERLAEAMRGLARYTMGAYREALGGGQ